MGQLKRVDEPTDAGGLGTIDAPNQPTSYSYDTLNNLITVNQGTQTRSFVYDSLSRLKSATNPEMGTTSTNGTISYSYDPNGNLETKTDARNITTTYAYDNLNRVKTRSYNDGITPAVSYFYDNLTNAKGKLIKVSSSISTTEYTSFDILGRVLSHKQMTDGNAYTTAYSYNLSGALIEETYPSGRVVKNVLDADGDLAIVQSKKNQTSGFFNYAKNFTYTSAGAVSSMQLGNGKWESTQFNPRLQPTQIALGTVQNGFDKLKLNFDYGITTNNGNVQSQTITVPTVGANQGFSAVQTYTYDSLNRLKTAEETTPNQAGWKQTFDYDRYGNRRFNTDNAANTTTLPAGCQTAVCNPTIDPATNRLVGYTFDNAGNTKVDATGRTFIYDAENKQTEVKDGNNVSIGQYSYDGDGKRVKKYLPGSGETTIFVYDASGKMVAEYSTTVAPASEAKVSYLTNDHLGSPRITTDANGGVISRRDFLPFGEEIYTAQRTQGLGYTADNVKQGFTGYIKDDETDLEFAQARMYANRLGRFTTVDPLMASAKAANPKTWNRYIYTLNNPLKYVDLDGMDVQVLDAKAQDILLKTLPEKIREKVKAEIEKGKGTLTKDSLKKIKSNDENFAALTTLVNAKEITEVATGTTGTNGVAFFKTTDGAQREKDIRAYMKANNVSRADAEKLIPAPTDPSAVMGYYGQTFSPNGENNTPISPSGNLRAMTTDQTGDAATISEEEAVVTMGHELYGHAYFYRTGNKTWAGEGPVITAIEERTRNNYRGEQKKNSPSNIKPKQ